MQAVFSRCHLPLIPASFSLSLSPRLCPQHQYAEAPRVPEFGGPERPAAGGVALWELWLHHGLNAAQPPSLLSRFASTLLLLGAKRELLIYFMFFFFLISDLKELH